MLTWTHHLHGRNIEEPLTAEAVQSQATLVSFVMSIRIEFSEEDTCKKNEEAKVEGDGNQDIAKKTEPEIEPEIEQEIEQEMEQEVETEIEQEAETDDSLSSDDEDDSLTNDSDSDDVVWVPS